MLSFPNPDTWTQFVLWWSEKLGFSHQEEDKKKKSHQRIMGSKKRKSEDHHHHHHSHKHHPAAGVKLQLTNNADVLASLILIQLLTREQLPVILNIERHPVAWVNHRHLLKEKQWIEWLRKRRIVSLSTSTQLRSWFSFQLAHLSEDKWASVLSRMRFLPERDLSDPSERYLVLLPHPHVLRVILEQNFQEEENQETGLFDEIEEIVPQDQLPFQREIWLWSDRNDFQKTLQILREQLIPRYLEGTFETLGSSAGKWKLSSRITMDQHIIDEQVTVFRPPLGCHQELT